MAGPTEQAARTDLSPRGRGLSDTQSPPSWCWCTRRPRSSSLFLKGDRAGTSAWRSDTARRTGERPRVGGASIYRYRSGEREGRGAGPRPAQLRWRVCRCAGI